MDSNSNWCCNTITISHLWLWISQHGLKFAPFEARGRLCWSSWSCWGGAFRRFASFHGLKPTWPSTFGAGPSVLGRPHRCANRRWLHCLAPGFWAWKGGRTPAKNGTVDGQKRVSQNSYHCDYQLFIKLTLRIVVQLRSSLIDIW